VSPPITWTYEPSVLGAMLAASIAYGYGWRRARQPGEPHPPGYGRLTLFCLSVLTILVALVSPVDGLARYLMVIHMTQHVLLLDIAPILLILSLTKGLLRPVTRRLTVIESGAGFLARPWFAVVLYVGVMWFWHVPAMYDLALRHNDIHALEHVCFGTAGMLYWWHLLSPIPGRYRLTGMAPVVYMVVTKLLVGMLGVILAFAPHCFYPWYQHHPDYWGLSPREDQNLAGVVMALEQSIVMGIALTYLFVRMLTESERQAQRAERYGIIN